MSFTWCQTTPGGQALQSPWKRSRIVPMFPQGSAVTVPRGYADIIVTEYGIARLKHRTLRQRIEELIAIAHPDFRAEIRAEARRLYVL